VRSSHSNKAAVIFDRALTDADISQATSVRHQDIISLLGMQKSVVYFYHYYDNQHLLVIPRLRNIHTHTEI